MEHPIEIPGLSIFVLGTAATDADLASSRSKFPLVLISHGTGGSAMSMAWLGIELARHGFVVAAVNHPMFARVVEFSPASDAAAQLVQITEENAADCQSASGMHQRVSGKPFGACRTRSQRVGLRGGC